MTREVPIDKLNDFADEFWKFAKNEKVFAFYGLLGAGKTTIIKALCITRGVKSIVSSPTFSIINEYFFLENDKEKIIYHIDLYRLDSTDEIFRTGEEECIISGSICFVEWPEKAPHLFEYNALHVFITSIDETKRSVKIISASQLNKAEQS